MCEHGFNKKVSPRSTAFFVWPKQQHHARKGAQTSKPDAAMSKITGLTAEKKAFYLQLISLLPFVEHRLVSGKTQYVYHPQAGKAVACCMYVGTETVKVSLARLQRAA